MLFMPTKYNANPQETQVKTRHSKKSSRIVVCIFLMRKSSTRRPYTSPPNNKTLRAQTTSPGKEKTQNPSPGINPVRSRPRISASGADPPRHQRDFAARAFDFPPPTRAHSAALLRGGESPLRLRRCRVLSGAIPGLF